MIRQILAILAFVLILSVSFAGSQVVVAQMNPLVKGQDLELELILFNKGNSDGSALIKFNYFGEPFEPAIEPIKSGSSKRLVYNLKNIKEGTIVLAIFSDENKFYEISIPKNFSQAGVLPYREVGSGNYTEANSEKNGFEKFFPFISAALRENFLLAIGVIAVIAVFVFVLLKTVFKKKNLAEKQIEINEVLLEEAEKVKQSKK